jgi:hypothetical protein
MTKELQPGQLSQSPETPITLTPVGYVKKLGGQVEAIILQDSEMQVVHEGEHFAGRYRIVRISPESVEAIDETTMLASTHKPNPPGSAKLSAGVIQPPTSDVGAHVASSKVNEQLTDNRSAVVGGQPFGYVEKAGGRLEVEATAAPILMTSVGYVEKANGEVAAILSEMDDVYVVRQGDHFAGRYLAAKVSREGVEALGLSTQETSPLSDSEVSILADVLESDSCEVRFATSTETLCLQSYRNGTVRGFAVKSIAELTSSFSQPAHGNIPLVQQPGTSLAARGRRKPSGKKLASPDRAPLIFQTLGSIEGPNREMSAIIADESQVYIVKQGEVFADKYQAISVDPGLVLAIRAPINDSKDVIFNRANDSTMAASKRMQGVKYQTSAGTVRWQTLHAVGAPVVVGLTDVGVGLFNLSGFMGFDLQSHLVMADNI